MGRSKYFQEIKTINSPLLLMPDHLQGIMLARTNDVSEPTDQYLAFADTLFSFTSDAAKTRAEFIRMQCNNIDAYDFFEQHCESWGIPKFDEGLITADDFKNGFLWTFRDHSTSWCEDQAARDWFSKTLKHNLYGTTSFGLATMDQTKLYHKKRRLQKHHVDHCK